MEDEESDMPVSVEGPKEGDKHLEKPQHSNINSEDVTDIEKSICSSKEKNGDIVAADHEDSIKPKLKNTLGVPGDIESETNNSESHSDSDVPLNPKKVNGEVELPKYSEKDENAGNSMDAVSLTKSGVPENEDDTSEHEKRTSRKRKRSVSSNELPESDHSDAGDYKGVKKPARGDVSLTAIKNGSQHNISGEVDPSVKCTSESLKSASIEFPVIITPPTLHDGVESSAQLTEYAQYLGLQPTVKFKCYKCGETGFPSMPVLQEHQNVCFKTLNRSQPIVKPPPTATVEPTPSTNIRITRKVYLCSVCGTYYENWNLFLHIREVHKRHICLFCLGMFAHSDNLVSHLSVRHGVIEESFSSADDFLNEYKDSCFLMCCTCEKLFTERENFFDHNCVEGLSVSVDKACSLCGLKGAHFPTCRQAFTDSDASPPQSTSSVSTPLKCSEDAVQDPPLLLKEQSGKKQATPVNKIAENKDKRKELDVENVAEGNEKLKDLSDLDDEYDISNAASFCHVNIDETPERNKANVEKDNSVKDNSDKNKTAIETPPVKPVQVENKEDACLEESNVKDNSETTAIVPENDRSKVCEAEQPEQDAADQKNNTEETSLTSDVTESAEEQKESNKDSLEEMPGDLELDKSSTKEDFHCENASLDDTSDKIVHIEEPKAQEQEEPDAKLLLNSESCPKSPPKLEAQTSSKTPSATEAESESESSDSPEETDESSSSSESSDESNHNDDIKKDKMGVAESDIDNADSDKMSLIVDETKSEDEKEMQDEANTLDEMQTDDVQQTENGDDSMREEINELEIKKETDQGSENGNQEAAEEMHEKKEVENRTDDVVENIQLAGEDVPLLELTLEENLDTLTIQTLLKESVKISCLNCVYCNHAKKIAVNGKQLALHLLAEHRFAPVVCSDSGELTEVDGFVDKLKASLLDLQQMYFNTDSYDNMDPNSNCQYDRTYECFHCHFVTTLHKELYVHNRKMHQKTILLCIMCKSNFYSYSELLCHLCPGIYVPESNITFRCCLCTVDGLPSAFRLMVHLRKRHHACDVCLETTGDQQKLSNHVWKHKLHHLCYRCGIAYRNKPDITKHLFWKHGTESVLCKKCLQKKWPHVYHFCIPPNAFVCEECNSTFSRAVALKVHKRIHAGDLPYACNECEERYISRKILMKHQLKHRDPPAEENMEIKMEENGPSTEAESQKDLRVDVADVTVCDSDEPKEKVADDDGAEQVKLETVDADSDSVIKNEEVLDPDMQDDTPTKENVEESAKLDEKETERKSRVVDVYDLPPLNLSSESDDSDEEEKSIQKEEKSAAPETLTQPVAAEKKLEEIDKTSEVFPTEEQPVPIVDGIWDNFKNYKANLERRESQQAELTESSASLFQATAFRERESAEVIEIINMDHDYCGPAAGTSQSKDFIEDTENAPTMSATSLQENLVLSDEQKETDEDKKPVDADHNYCYNNPNSPSSNVEKEKESLPTPSSAITPSKKKQKSPKKKQKRSGSSSSSESSSNSDSSSCSCGTNCSCSSSSSSSSGSSSSSSDSDSSTSEGRRRQAARRERRRERAKKRKSEEISDTAPVQLEVADTANIGPALQSEALALPIGPELEETELPIRESDLDTDETETDEDFYDKYPQKLANKLLAEKRNQLLLLAAVAPVNNGTMTQTGQSALTSSVEDQTTKRKVKTKKRKRSHLPHTNTVERVEQNLKMNIPSDYYTSQNPTFSKSSLSSTAMSPLHASSQSHPAVSHPDPSSLSTAYHSTGSGSETESKRASKRKRVPKRFYGDSSDEETEQQPAVKWRKVASTTSGSPLQTSMPASAFAYKSTPLMASEPRVPPAPTMEDKSEEEAGEDSDSDVRKSSSDSSNSESEAEKEDDASDGDSDADSVSVFQTNTSTSVKEGETGQQKNENLYCYCQCPYDEVSEMIACDGKDCTIEWFHFECVGIMVPPKGKWFCPDCRKRATSRSDYVPNV